MGLKIMQYRDLLKILDEAVSLIKPDQLRTEEIIQSITTGLSGQFGKKIDKVLPLKDYSGFKIFTKDGDTKSIMSVIQQILMSEFSNEIGITGKSPIETPDGLVVYLTAKSK